MSRAEKAVETFGKRYNCCQAVLTAFCEELGLDAETAMRIASGFGGGIGHMGETCGAVTGAIMVISLKKGMSMPDHPFRSNQAVYPVVHSFVSNFIKRNKSIKCRDLLGFDISNNEALLKARQDGVFQKICPGFIADAVKILEDMPELT